MNTKHRKYMKCMRELRNRQLKSHSIFLFSARVTVRCLSVRSAVNYTNNRRLDTFFISQLLFALLVLRKVDFNFLTKESLERYKHSLPDYVATFLFIVFEFILILLLHRDGVRSLEGKEPAEVVCVS